jgi:hypothetical protein
MKRTENWSLDGGLRKNLIAQIATTKVLLEPYPLHC